jgi:cell wall-associated NlpC family hydrolase
VSTRSVRRPLFAGVALLALTCCPLAEQKTGVLHAVAAASSVTAPAAKPEPLQPTSGEGLLDSRPAPIVGTPRVAPVRKKALAPKTGDAVATAQLASRSTGQLVLAGDDLTAGTAAQTALSFALDQLGKPYVWGAEGPDTYDCSGLTMRAYEAAGYQLPRTAAEQALVGTPVDVADLLPGDLLFYATDPSDLSTVHHVVMYAGAGMVVHAPHQGDVVRIGPMWLGDEYAGAVRIVDAAPAPKAVAKTHPKRSAAPAKHAKPTAHPTKSPIPHPSRPAAPTPTNGPSVPASDVPPSGRPTGSAPTGTPTPTPSVSPTVTPTGTPSGTPTETPTATPTTPSPSVTTTPGAELPADAPKNDPIVPPAS